MAGIEVNVDIAQAKKATAQLRTELKTLATSASKNEKEFSKLNSELGKTTNAKKSTNAVDDLKKSTRLARLETAKLQKSVGNTSGAFKTLATGAKLPVSAIAGITVAIAAFTAGVAKTTKTGMEFENVMKTVGAVSRATANEFDALSAKAREMGASTEWSASQSATALKFMAMAGMSAADSIKALPGMLDLATAAQMDLATASDIATDTLTAFGMETAEITRLSDALVNTSTRANTTVSMLGESFKFVAPVAANMGYSIEEASGMLGVLANSGIKAEMAGTSLRQMMLKSGKAAKSMGMDIDSSLIDVLEEMHKRQFSVNDVVQQFGIIASTGATILMNNVDAYKKLTTEIENNRDATTGLATDMRDTLTNDFKALGSILEESTLKMFDVFGPDMRELVSDMTDMVKDNQDAFVLLGESIAGATRLLDSFAKHSSSIKKSLGSTAIGQIFKLQLVTLKAIGEQMEKNARSAAGLGEIIKMAIPDKPVEIVDTENLSALSDEFAKLISGSSNIARHTASVNEYLSSIEKKYQSVIDGKLSSQIKATEEELKIYEESGVAQIEIAEAISEKLSDLRAKYAKANGNSDQGQDLFSSVGGGQSSSRARKAYAKVYDKYGIISEEYYDQQKTLYQSDMDAFILATGNKEIALAVYAEKMQALNVAMYGESDTDITDPWQQYAEGLEKATGSADTLQARLDALKGSTFEGQSFGNELADGINNAILSMQSLNEMYDEQAVKQEKLKDLKEEIENLDDGDEKTKKLKEVNEIELDMITDTVSAYRQLFGTVSQLYDENSKERKVMHNLEMGFAAVEIALNATKAVSLGVVAVINAMSAGDPYTAIARGLAVAAVVGSALAQIGGTFGMGGGSDAAVASIDTTTQGTVLGDTSATSESIANSYDILEDMNADQYAELQGIHYEMKDLNANITGLISGIVRDFGSFAEGEAGIPLSYSTDGMFGGGSPVGDAMWADIASGPVSPHNYITYTL